jgi:hypothetical protein
MPAACSVRFGKYLPAKRAVVDPNAAKARRPALDEASANKLASDTATSSSAIRWPPSDTSGQATKSGKPYEIDLHRDSKICVADEQVTDKGYEPVRELRPVDEHFARWTSQPSPGMQPSVNTTTSSPMSKRKTAKGLGGLQDRKNRQATRPNPIRGRRADRMAKSTHQ